MEGLLWLSLNTSRKRNKYINMIHDIYLYIKLENILKGKAWSNGAPMISKRGYHKCQKIPEINLYFQPSFFLISLFPISSVHV